ncbi:MAG: hypothetical protein QOG72_3211 [Sphingomonadales bacterium]|jgi:hypothetical protein|nr:hypothetical protein [Sphingomonadales bacterium]
MARLATLLLALALAGCAAPQQARVAAAAAPGSCAGGATLRSPPGKAWWEENRWRYTSDEAAAAAYAQLADNASPSLWPDWYRPYETRLPPGTRFQMAIGGAQTPDQPGSFGTFDRIGSVADVREDLAVRSDWKPKVDRVVTYEVVRELPVRIGPIGPQVDPGLCALLPGRWSQFQALVEKGTLRGYLKVIEVRAIH